MKKFVLLTFIVLNSFIFTVNAQDIAGKNTVSSMGINPAIVEVVLDKDNPTERVITLSNLTNLPIPVKTIKQSFTAKEKLEIPEDKLGRYDASSWIELSDSDTDFILQPQEIKNINLRINQPADASPGGHYATVIFEPLIPEGLVSENSVYIYARVAALLFMQVKGDIIEDISVEGLSANIINEPGNIDFRLSLKNNGNNHIRPKSEIVIKNALTQEEVIKQTFQEGMVLPGTTRNFPLAFESNSLFGIYSYTSTVNYGASSIVENTPTQYFIVMPYKVVIGAALILGAILYVKKFRSRFSKAAKLLIKGEDLPTSTNKEMRRNVKKR